MQNHPHIRCVLYPGLPEFPGHKLAARQMHGFGGMLSIEVDGGFEQAAAVADNLQLFLLATSLGGVESLVSQPCATSHLRPLSAGRTPSNAASAMAYCAYRWGWKMPGI